MGGDIRLCPANIDIYPHNVVAHLVARELPTRSMIISTPARFAAQGAAARCQAAGSFVLERWGYPVRAKPLYTAADEERIRANRSQGRRAGGVPLPEGPLCDDLVNGPMLFERRRGVNSPARQEGPTECGRENSNLQTLRNQILSLTLCQFRPHPRRPA